MRAHLFLVPCLTLLPACMSLDGMVIPEYPLDAYEFPADAYPLELVEVVAFTAADGAPLSGVWLHQPGWETDPKPPLIWFHGNGGSIQDYWDRATYYASWGTHEVFLPDYRGYGTSPGPATHDGILEEDGLGAVQYVSDATGYAPEDIGWVALSLGAAVAAHTGDEIPARGIVLESMFASTDLLLDRGAGLNLPTGWFFEDTWDNVAAVRDLISPVFVIHGQQDDFIDPEASIQVYDAAPDPKFIWRPVDVDHTNAPELYPDAYRDAVLSFLADPYAGPTLP